MRRGARLFKLEQDRRVVTRVGHHSLQARRQLAIPNLPLADVRVPANLVRVRVVVRVRVRVRVRVERCHPEARKTW